MIDSVMTQSTASLVLNPDFPYGSYAEYIVKSAALEDDFRMFAVLFTFSLHVLPTIMPRL